CWREATTITDSQWFRTTSWRTAWASPSVEAGPAWTQTTPLGGFLQRAARWGSWAAAAAETTHVGAAPSVKAGPAWTQTTPLGGFLQRAARWWSWPLRSAETTSVGASPPSNSASAPGRRISDRARTTI